LYEAVGEAVSHWVKGMWACWRIRRKELIREQSGGPVALNSWEETLRGNRKKIQEKIIPESSMEVFKGSLGEKRASRKRRLLLNLK